MSEWHELKNGQPMPPFDHDVLIWTGAAETPRMFTAMRVRFPNGHKGWHQDHDGESTGFSKVTHWRELPAVPSVKAENP